MEEDAPTNKVETTIEIDKPDDNTTSNNDTKKNAEQPFDDNADKNKFPYVGRTYTVMYNMDNYDADEITEAEPWSRKRFIRKTFMIVFALLLITAICSGLVRIPGTAVNDFFLHYGNIIAICSGILLIGLSYAFSCIAQTRYPPCIYFMIPLMVICYTLLTAAITVRHRTDSLLIAITATVVVLLVAIALSFTQFDFTRWYAIVGFAMLGVMIASIITAVLSLVLGIKLVIVQLIICLAATAIMTVCLIIELQMIMGGKTIEISETEYLTAAFMVYSSIITIFLNLLQMINLFDML